MKPRPRLLRSLRWAATAAVAALVLVWVWSMWRGVAIQHRPLLLHIEGGAFSYWIVSASNAHYGGDGPPIFYPVQHADLQSLVPMWTSAPGRFDYIGRLPIWMPMAGSSLLGGVLW